MRTWVVFWIGVLWCGFPFGISASDEESSLVRAREMALELAGAFANDGYKIRDGAFTAPLTPAAGEKPLPEILYAVHLFQGNEYWFCAAVSHLESQPRLQAYDADGNPVTGKVYAEANTAAFGFVPDSTGLYFLGLSLPAGQPCGSAVVYCYK